MAGAGVQQMQPFPMMWLSNELLAGVAQRLSDGARRQQELVDSRLAAVTRAHGYVHRHELDIMLDTAKMKVAAAPPPKRRRADVPPAPTRQPIIVLGDATIPLASARGAVLSRLSRSRRIVTLRLMMAPCFDADSFACWSEQSSALIGLLGALNSSDRLRLTSTKIDADFGLGLDGVEANVALLLQRHAATITDLHLVPCAFRHDDAATHEHAELCQAVAACTAVQRFTVRVGREGCLGLIAHDCLPAFKQLRTLEFHEWDQLDFDALPRPSQLKELRVNEGSLDTTALSDAAQERADVFGSLRVLAIDYRYRDPNDHADLLDQLYAYSPCLDDLTVKFQWFKEYGRFPPYITSLLTHYFDAPGPRQLHCKLVVNWDSFCLDAEVHAIWSFEELCGELLAAFHAGVPEVGMACWDEEVFVIACGAIFEAAVATDPAVSASIGGAFVGFLQAQSADAPATADMKATAAWLLIHGVHCEREFDYDAAAPFFTAAVAATGVRVEVPYGFTDSESFVRACVPILKAAINADLSAGAIIAGAFIDLLQSHAADAPAYAAAKLLIGSLLINSALPGNGYDFDYDDAAPFYAAMLAATDVRFELGAERADNQHEHEEVAVRLTRGHGADERQLDLVIRTSR